MSKAIILCVFQESNPSMMYTCIHVLNHFPTLAKYADPWKGGSRLYRKRLSDLAAMVTETLIWEKSKQHKKGKQGSNSTLYSKD